ncbi:MAG: PAS domain-containing protein [Pseudomonadota bacterium]
MHEIVDLIDKYNLLAVGSGLICLLFFTVIYRLKRHNAAQDTAIESLKNDMRQLNVGMLKVSGTGIILFANYRAEKLLGRTVDSLNGMFFSECFVENDKSAVKDGGNNGTTAITACTNSSRLFVQIEYGHLDVEGNERDVFIHDIDELQRAYDLEHDRFNKISTTLTELDYGRIKLDLKSEHMVLDDRAKQLLSSPSVKLDEMSSRQTLEALKSRIHKEDELKWNKFISVFQQDGKADGIFRFMPLDKRVGSEDLGFEPIHVSLCSAERSSKQNVEGHQVAEAIITKNTSVANLTDLATHSEIKLKAIISTSSNPMYVVDREGKLLDYNSSFSNMMKMLDVKIDRDDFYSSEVFPESIIALHQPVTGVISHSKQAQFSVTDRNKKEVHLHVTLIFAHMSNFLDEKQNLQVVGSIQNITETVTVTKTLESERAQLAKIYDLAPLAIAKVNAENRITMTNHLLTHILRYTENECKALHLHDLVVDREDAAQIATTLKRSGKVREFSTTLRAKDESLYPCELNIDLINREDQEYLIWIFDKTAERFEQNKFETLLDNCNMPMAILGEDSFLSVNAPAVDFFGQQDEQQLLSMMPYDHSLNYDEQKSDELKREIDHVVLTGKVNSFVWEYHVGGDKLPCHCTFIPVFKDQAFESILCMFIDQRELLRADEERIQALALQQQAIAEQRIALNEVEETQAKLTYSKEQLANTESALASIQGEYERTRQEAEAKQKQLLDSKDRLASFEDQLASVQDQYNKTREEAEAKQRQLQESKEQLATTEVQLASVIECYDNTREEAEAAQQQLIDSKDQLANTEKELATVHERYVETREEAEAAQQQLIDSKDQLANTEQRLASVQERYDATREEAEAARKQLNESKDQLETTKQQLVSVQAQFDQTRQEAAVTQKQLTDSNDKLANTVEQLASVQAQFDETRQEYSDLKQSHENVAENLKVLQNQYNQSRDLLAAAEQSNQDLTSQLEDADRQVQGLSEQREEIIRALNDSEANYQKAQKALAASEANVEQLEDHLQEERARQGALEREISEMQQAVSTKDQEINSVNAKIDQLQGQLSHSKDATEILKSQLDSQREAREAAEQEQKALEQSYQSARTELSNKERNLDHMQEELKKLEAMSQQERSDMQAQQAVLEQELDAKHEQLQQTADELESARIASEHEKRASKAQQQLVARLQNELQSAESEISEKQVQMNEKEQALKQTQQDLMSELKNKQLKLQEAEDLLRNTKEQNKAEKEQHQQAIENLKSDLSEIEERSAEQQQIIQQSDEQWQRDKEALAQEINARREQLALTKDELEEFQSQADKERYARIEQENKLEQLRAELTDVESRAEKQHQMMAGNEEQWQRHHEEIEQQKQRLQESLQQANIQNQELQKQLEGKLDALNQAELQVNESKHGEQELVDELESARAEAESLQLRIEEQADQEKALQAQLEQQQDALQSKESTIVELQSSQDALAAELAQVQAEYAQSKQTLSEQQNSHDGLNSQMSELEQALAESQQALLDKETALSEVQKALESSQSKLEEQETELVEAHKKELQEYSQNAETSAARIPDIEELEMPDNPAEWFDLLPYLQSKGEIDSLPKALSELIESLQESLNNTEQAIEKNNMPAIYSGIRAITAIAKEVNSEVLTDIMSAIEFDCKCGLVDNVSIRWPAAKQSLQQTLRVVYSHLHA